MDDGWMIFLLSRLLGLLYSQLQCHVTSCDPLSEHDSSKEKEEEEEEEEEAFSLTLCTLARHLAETVRKCCNSLSIRPDLSLPPLPRPLPPSYLLPSLFPLHTTPPICPNLHSWQGEFDKSEALLKSALRYLNHTRLPYKVVL